MRDYGWCIKRGYTAYEYADYWADDLYNQLLDSVFECFWDENEEDAHDYEGIVTVTDEGEKEAYKACYEAYKECYLRYQRAPEDNFEEWEVNDAAQEVIEILFADLADQLERYKEYGEGKE